MSTGRYAWQTFSKCSTSVKTHEHIAFAGVSQAVSALHRGDLLQTFPLWQLRLVVELWDSRMQRGPANRRDTLLTSEFLPVMKNAVDATLDSWLKGEERLHVQNFSLIGSIVLFWGFLDKDTFCSFSSVNHKCWICIFHWDRRRNEEIPVQMKEAIFRLRNQSKSIREEPL